jgi:hypothetical protein
MVLYISRAHRLSSELMKKGIDIPAVALVLPERLVFLLEPLTVQHGVLRLLDRGTDQVEAASNLDGLLDLVGGPLGGTPVEGLAL